MNLFDPDGKFMQIWNTVFDYFKLGLLCLLMCVPVVTAGASVTAAFCVAMKMARGEAPAVWKPYWKSLKENFKQATGIFFLCLIVAAVLGFDWYQAFQMESTAMVRALRAVLFVVALFLLMSALYLFPLLARYNLTNRQIFHNSVIFAILNFPKNLLAVAFILIFLLLCDYLYQALPVYIAVFPGGMLFYMGRVCVKTFSKRIEGAGEEEDVPETEIESA